MNFSRLFLLRVAGGFQLFIDEAVGQGINAADEETRDAGDVRDVLALGGARFKRRDICLGDLLIRGLREEQRDVDVDAFFEELADGRDAFFRPGTLIITFGRLTIFQSRRASSSVFCISRASVGETSRLT